MRKESNDLYPYDNETFMQYEGKAYSVVTNIETGQPEYLRLKDMDKDVSISDADMKAHQKYRKQYVDVVKYWEECLVTSNR